MLYVSLLACMFASSSTKPAGHLDSDSYFSCQHEKNFKFKECLGNSSSNGDVLKVYNSCMEKADAKDKICKKMLNKHHSQV